MPDAVRIAAVQMNAGADKQVNIDEAVELIERASNQGAHLVVLPETWTFMGAAGAIRDNAEPIPGPTVERLAEVARKHQIFVHAGSMFEVAPGAPRVYNASAVLDPNGNLIGHYRKIHLFDVSIANDVESRESATVAPGDEVVLVDLDGVKLGLTICYDLRFPELYRLLALQGADIVTVPAAFHYHTGKDHWEVLLRARAIENQYFVVGANAWGSHPGGWKSYGRSMVVDPWGVVLATVGDGVGLAVAECDLTSLARIRRELPSLANRQPEACRWSEIEAGLLQR